LIDALFDTSVLAGKRGGAMRNGIFDVRCIRSLSLNHNPLISITEKLPLMMNIKRLDLSYCQLKDISLFNFHSSFPELDYLDISNNKLSTLPENLFFANNLSFLSIENNELKEIPAFLGMLKNIKTLLVQGNPQRLIRPNLIAQGSAKVIEYLKTKYNPSDYSFHQQQPQETISLISNSNNRTTGYEEEYNYSQVHGNDRRQQTQQPPQRGEYSYSRSSYEDSELVNDRRRENVFSSFGEGAGGARYQSSAAANVARMKSQVSSLSDYYRPGQNEGYGASQQSSAVAIPQRESRIPTSLINHRRPSDPDSNAYGANVGTNNSIPPRTQRSEALKRFNARKQGEDR
jgi:hypothetical protein